MDQPATRDSTRIIKVTAANLCHHHLYISGHYDFFPADCIGAARKPANGDAGQIEIVLDGLDKVIRTDIPKDARTGKPRAFLREPHLRGTALGRQ